MEQPQATDQDPPRLMVQLLGTGGAIPYKQRTNSSTCLATEKSTVLVDCGTGTIQGLAVTELNLQAIDAIFLTHTHADHCLELPLLVLGIFLAGREKELQILGPPGTSAHVDLLFENVYPYLMGLIREVIGRPPVLSVHDLPETIAKTVLNDLTVTSGPTKHYTPALGYRFECSGISVALSGDTEPCETMVDLARDCDLLIHESSFPPDEGDVRGHSAPKQVGEISARANAKQLILTHLFEETLGKEQEILQSVGDAYSGPTMIGHDLLRIALPTGDTH